MQSDQVIVITRTRLTTHVSNTKDTALVYLRRLGVLEFEIDNAMAEKKMLVIGKIQKRNIVGVVQAKLII